MSRNKSRKSIPHLDKFEQQANENINMKKHLTTKISI